MANRWIEFFEGEKNRLSMSRLMMFLSFFPATYVVIKDAGEATLGWFVSAYVLGFVGGKGMDALGGKNANNSDNMELPKSDNNRDSN